MSNTVCLLSHSSISHSYLMAAHGLIMKALSISISLLNQQRHMGLLQLMTCSSQRCVFPRCYHPNVLCYCSTIRRPTVRQSARCVKGECVFLFVYLRVCDFQWVNVYISMVCRACISCWFGCVCLCVYLVVSVLISKTLPIVSLCAFI